MTFRSQNRCKKAPIWVSTEGRQLQCIVLTQLAEYCWFPLCKTSESCIMIQALYIVSELCSTVMFSCNLLDDTKWMNKTRYQKFKCVRTILSLKIIFKLMGLWNYAPNSEPADSASWGKPAPTSMSLTLVDSSPIYSRMVLLSPDRNLWINWIELNILHPAGLSNVRTNSNALGSHHNGTYWSLNPSQLDETSGITTDLEAGPLLPHIDSVLSLIDPGTLALKLPM